jgi:hypothetical protein
MSDLRTVNCIYVLATSSKGGPVLNLNFVYINGALPRQPVAFIGGIEL